MSRHMRIGSFIGLIRKNSLLAGVLSGVLLSIVTVGVIALNTTSTEAATLNNCSTSKPTVRPGDRGSCVSLAQQLLASRGYFKAGVTGYYGPVTKDAVLQLQADQGISQVGYIGPKTWAALGEASDSGATVNSGSTIAASLPAKCITTAKTICIVKGSGSKGTLYAVQNKQVERSFPVRTGDARGAAYETTDGTWSVGRRYTMWYSKSYNNAPMPYSLFFHGGEAIHYSSDFAKNGYGGAGSSAGCVNVGTMNDAKWIYNWSPLYTRVVVTG